MSTDIFACDLLGEDPFSCPTAPPETDIPRSKVDFRVSAELIANAQMLGIDLQEMVEFFANQIQGMMACPSNYNYFGVKAQAWIMRGYYPKSPLFFKITIAFSEEGPRYFCKVSPLRVIYTTKHKNKIELYTDIDFNTIQSIATARLENALLEANNEIEKLKLSIKYPRCMSPKGMPIFKLDEAFKRRQGEAATVKD